MRFPSPSWIALAGTLLLGAPGCDQPPPSGPDAGPLEDSGPVGPIVPDGSVPCETAEDCDDGIECTIDSCAADGYCRNAPMASMCDDGVFCNGQERCEPSLGGCVPPLMRETCNDDNVCTVDRCDEETDSCIHTPRDLDLDGDVDWFCPGGGDCDDRDPTLSSLTHEVCGDRIDNDCDGEVDEPDCGRPPADLCDDPIDVSRGGFFQLDVTGAEADYPLRCASPGWNDQVVTFTIDMPRSVTIESEGDFSRVALSLRTECGDAASEIACENDYPGGVLRQRSLEPGTYFVVVASQWPGPVGLRVRFGDPIDPVGNETCEAPTDVSEGGSVTGTFPELSDYALSCGTGGAELVYTFTTEAERDVEITATSLTGSRLTWELRSSCEDGDSALRCVHGAPAQRRIHQLPEGTYFLVLEGSAATEFRMEVRFLDPTPPIPGDLCENALPLALSTTEVGTLADKQDDYDVGCGFFYRDAVHAFTLEEPADVTVTFDAGDWGNMSIRSECGSELSELRCVSGSPARARLRGLSEGTYYVIPESYGAGTYSIQVEATSPPVPLTEVSGNDTCSEPHDIPATGGFFHGNTTGLSADYGTALCGGGAAAKDAVFRLELTSQQRVVASTEGSTFDTVLHVHSEACANMGEEFCDDDGGEGTTSRIDRVLDPGTWFIVVDGYGSGSAGEYYLEVTVSDPP